jgi:DHA2 family multidrug resistance protein-like MFS transporter
VLVASSILVVVACVGAALSTDAAALIAWRCAQGAAGAGTLASVVGTIGSQFTGADLAVANGAWVAVVGAGNALGPVLGGVITDAAGWRWIFALPALAAFVSCVLSVLFLPNSSAGGRPRLDPLGMILSGVVAGTAIEGMNTLPGSPLAGGLLLLISTASCLALFRWQRRSDHPLIDGSLFRDRRFAVAAVRILASAASASGCLYAVSLQLQQTRGLSATGAGLVLLPLAIAATGGGIAAPRALSWFGSATIVRVALLAQAVGLAAVTVAGVPLPIALAVAGFGYGVVGAVATTTLFESATHIRASQAGVLQEVVFALGAAAGIALLGAVASAAGYPVAFLIAAGITVAAALPRGHGRVTRRARR